jgi:sugar O-acyltransferase (sialic acid O-acetyltransferase NeuD family)
MPDLVVVGAGGFGRETLDVIEAVNRASSEPVHRVLGVLDDSPTEVSLGRLADLGVQWLGPLDAWLGDTDGVQAVIAVGSPAARQRIAAKLAGRAFGGVLVHPNAVLGSRCSLGRGSIICSGVNVSTNVRVGEFAHLNPSCVVGHDAVLEDFVSLNPGAIISGEVRVGEGSLVGAGAVVLQGLTVGARTTIGAQACVTRSRGGGVLKGIPAR